MFWYPKNKKVLYYDDGHRGYSGIKPSGLWGGGYFLCMIAVRKWRYKKECSAEGMFCGRAASQSSDNYCPSSNRRLVLAQRLGTAISSAELPLVALGSQWAPS